MRSPTLSRVHTRQARPWHSAMTKDIRRAQMSAKQLQEIRPERALSAKTTDEIVAAMIDEDAAAERLKILQKMSPECRKKLTYIENWLRKEMGHALHSRYELGLQVLDL